MRTFKLSEDQKNIICRRLPRGFTLSRPEDLPRFSKRQPPIVYPPSLIVTDQPLIKVQGTKPYTDLFSFQTAEPQFPVSSRSEIMSSSIKMPPAPTFADTYSVKSEAIYPGLDAPSLTPASSSMYSSIAMPLPPGLTQRQSSIVSSELSRSASTITQKSTPVYNIDRGKHKSTERLRIIVQRFKKHRKFPQLTNALSKLGQVASLSRIEQQIKRNYHTLDSFKEKVVELLSMMKEQPSLAELADEFLMFLSQLVLIGRQEEFEGNLQDIQKSVDRITRDLTDIKQQGQWYAKKKKRNDRPVYQKELIYICDLIRELPKAYLVGVWEIVNEKPFREARQYRMSEIDFSQLKSRKVRQVEYYVKKKLQNIRKSRQQKKEKLAKLRGKPETGVKEENKDNNPAEQVEPNGELSKYEQQPAQSSADILEFGLAERQPTMDIEYDAIKEVNEISNIVNIFPKAITQVIKPVIEPLDIIATLQENNLNPQAIQQQTHDIQLINAAVKSEHENALQNQPVTEEKLTIQQMQSLEGKVPEQNHVQQLNDQVNSLLERSSDSSMITDDEDSAD